MKENRPSKNFLLSCMMIRYGYIPIPSYIWYIIHICNKVQSGKFKQYNQGGNPWGCTHYGRVNKESPTRVLTPKVKMMNDCK